LYTALYQLEKAGLVMIDRNHPEGMLVGLIEHPDLAAMRPVVADDGITVPDDRDPPDA
jgi:hypothetical protein